MSKKGDTYIWWIIAVAIIAILVVIFILVWFKGSGEKAFGSINEKIGGLGDCDKDNTADMFDKCPCDAGEPNAELEGCPVGVTKDSLEVKNKVGDKECVCIK